MDRLDALDVKLDAVAARAIIAAEREAASHLQLTTPLAPSTEYTLYGGSAASKSPRPIEDEHGSVMWLALAITVGVIFALLLLLSVVVIGTRARSQRVDDQVRALRAHTDTDTGWAHLAQSSFGYVTGPHPSLPSIVSSPRC